MRHEELEMHSGECSTSPTRRHLTRRLTVGVGATLCVAAGLALVVARPGGATPPLTPADIYTVAGNGGAGFTADAVAATSSNLYYPAGVAVDAPGNLVIADTYNQRIRVVAQSTGTFYGQSMTAGEIYTVAGNGTAGYTADGIPPV